MSDLKTYFAAPGRAETPSAAEAGDLAVRFPWFLPGRILRETLTGESDPRVALTAPWRAESSLRRAAVDVSALTQLSSEEIIDRFLQEEDLRIVAGEGEPEEEVVLQPELDDDDEVVTEELAEIYRSRPSGQVRGDLSQIKFAKSRKKCLLCRTYWQNRKQY